MIKTDTTDLENTIESFFNLTNSLKKLQDELFAVESEMFYCEILMESFHKLQIESLREEVC